MHVRIKNALKEIDIPVYYLKRKNAVMQCIVYNYISSPLYYSDNTLKGTKYKILINLYITDLSKLEEIKNNVIKAMHKDGFQGGRAESTFIEKVANGSEVANTAITFNAYKLNNE